MNRETLWTGIVLATMTFVAVGLVKLVGSWIVRGMRADLEASIRQIVREVIAEEFGPPKR